MKKSMFRKYSPIFILGFESTLEYRGNYLINLVGILFPIMMQYFVWSAVFSGKELNERVFGLTYGEAIIYTLCAGFVSRLISTECHHQISKDIKSGALSQFLVQPVRYIIYQIFRNVGEKILELFLVLGIMMIFLFVIAPGMGLKVHVLSVAMFFAAFIPGITLNFLIFLSVSMLAFWIVEVGRLYSIIDILIAIVSGSIFPLSIFGIRWEHIFSFMPFTYTTYFLTNILNGSTNINEFLKGTVIQAVWICIFFYICRKMWTLGLKKYVAAGG